jgi:hypothetical protein
MYQRSWNQWHTATVRGLMDFRDLLFYRWHRRRHVDVHIVVDFTKNLLRALHS